MTTFVLDDSLEPDGYFQITDLSSVRSVAGGNGRIALIQTLNQNIRWRDDGVDPTSTIGMRLAAGETFLYTGKMQTIRLIEEAVGAQVNISTYK